MSWDQYTQEERLHFLQALEKIHLHTSIRSYFASTYRARSAALGDRQRDCFDQLVGPLDPRPMAFIPLRQGLVALLVHAILNHGGGTLAQDLCASGRVSGQSFLGSPTGQAIALTVGQDIRRLSDHMNMILSTVYDRGQALFHLSSDTSGRVIIDQIGCPAIQHWVWRGALTVMAERTGARLREVGSEAMDENAFFVDLDWSEDPNAPPPNHQRSKHDSNDQLRKVRSRSGMFHAALASFNADQTHTDTTRTYQLTDDFCAWFNAQHRFQPPDRALALASLRKINPLEGVRALYISRCRSLIAQRYHVTFDRLLGPVFEREMDFVPLSQAMVGILVTGCQLAPEASTIADVIVETGQWQGVLFVRSPAGQALRRAIEDDFSMIFKNFSAIMGAIFNRARARLEVLEPGHAYVVIEQTGGVELQHACWRGVMKGVAAELGVQLLNNQSGVLNENTLFLDLRWREPSGEIPAASGVTPQ